ncbi:MAG: hypothetical protein A2854_00735 [Parcubacteria group bacterium RIFCSPHIGHO2_01_FULL_56_18]|nr:MAG: hypothetical protein A2854_00735 [Parcubacteria group bacterium RIFCSPHIGHO2_01_FULL_56_18]
MTPSSLAINGGTPVRTKPWHESNAIGVEEQKAAERVLKSRYLSLFHGTHRPRPPFSFFGGPEVQNLERQAREQLGVSHVVSVNSATSGLFSAIGALGIGFGDEVIVSPYTMSACAMAPLVYGAIPIFADVERATGCLDPASIREKITERTKTILVVHQFGIPADMDVICAIAREHKLSIVEDCAQAWGATYKGKTVGTMGDIGVYSFNVHKTIDCGEGGLCITNNDELALRLQLIRNHGESVMGDAGYENGTNIVGFNYRLTEVQAAIAVEQLKKLESLNAERLALVETLSDGLRKHHCLITPDPPAERRATYYVYPLRYLAEHCGGTPRSEFARMLLAEGISFVEGYTKPLYLLPLFQKRLAYKHGYPWNATENKASKPNYQQGSCINAEKLHREEMLLNLYICPPQTEEDMHDIVKAVDKIIAACS